ncbi:23S rRNA pseudouridine1911/1915/1917 synthase [Neolewinella xylanilytica]|uniref:23S rRNA pseudouridine1911/1915/1917 synthase n=1 Tax=Neolewinella xylanilytica TaxID=1514080 RepID=A0A2S6IB10_9BACT|nr:RluA family pseudouridine synthase [Neolewinella xylanilytica]PPK88690.1 23S rRNA pseudouridine1911/1915/1917 synthase [Neolewinella xylanilytica]
MLAILQEGSGWVAINKPAGIATERHFQYDTVEARALETWKRPGATKAPYVGIVHRLDRVTSGALVLARRKSTLVRLNRAFAGGRTRKTYRSVTAVALPEPEGKLRHYLIRNPTNKLAVANTRPVPDGKEATLEYRLVQHRDALYEYEITPLTGRFHQIRAQLAAAGAPIMGDVAYGSKRILGDNQIALHAYSLTFPDPESDAPISVTAPLPEYWPIAR